jgi:ankyrin repeat protein
VYYNNIIKLCFIACNKLEGNMFEISLQKEVPADLLERVGNNWLDWLIKYFPRYAKRLNYLKYSYADLRDLRYDDPVIQAELHKLIEDGNYPLLFCLYYSYFFSNFSLEQKKFINAVIEADEIVVEKSLLQNARLVDLTDADDRTPLHHAASRGYVTICSLLLKSSANLNSMHYAGNTPLHEAASEGHYEVCELLLSNRADINSNQGNSEGELNDGDTPLHLAALNGHLAICQLLVSKGAKLHAKNAYKLLPFMSAANKHHDRVAEFLFKPLELARYCVLRTDFEALEKEKPLLEQRFKNVRKSVAGNRWLLQNQRRQKCSLR